MRQLLSLFAILAILLASVPAQAIESLGRLDYRVISQTGATPDPNGLWTITARPGETVFLTLTIEPRPTSNKGTVLYPLRQLILEKDVPNAHCVELQTLSPDPSLISWLASSAFDYTYPSGVQALGQYNGEPVNAGDLKQNPRLTLSWALPISAQAVVGEYPLNLRLERVYDGARMVDDAGLPAKDEILHWRVILQPANELNFNGQTLNPFSIPDEQASKVLVPITAALDKPLQALVSNIGKEFFLSQSKFTVIPFYSKPTANPGDFWGLLYAFGDDGSAGGWLQLNQPDQGYPAFPMLAPVTLDLMRNPLGPPDTTQYIVTCNIRGQQ